MPYCPIPHTPSVLFLCCFHAPSSTAHVLTGLFSATISLWPFVSPLVTQETQTQLLLCPGGVEWSEAASSCGALWGWIPAALCPRKGGDCQDTQPWPGANQGAFPGHPQTGAKWPQGRHVGAVLCVSCVFRWWSLCQYPISELIGPGVCCGVLHGRLVGVSLKLNNLSCWKRVGEIWGQHKSLQRSVCSSLGFDCNNYTKQAAIHQTRSRLIITLLPAN